MSDTDMDMEQNQQSKTGEGNAPRILHIYKDGKMPTEFPVRMSIELVNYYIRCEAQRDELLAVARQVLFAHDYSDTEGGILNPKTVSELRDAIANAELNPPFANAERWQQ